jgi:hypothetical protein
MDNHHHHHTCTTVVAVAVEMEMEMEMGKSHYPRRTPADRFDNSRGPKKGQKVCSGLLLRGAVTQAQ